MKNFPFETLHSAGGLEIRKFSAFLEEDELSWHRDREDRVVTLLSGSGWMLQLDESKPILMSPGKDFFVPAGVWHRAIRLNESTDLVVQVLKSIKCV